jgi:cytochrome c-type biogenesis protein CcmF
MKLGSFTLQMRDMTESDNPNYASQKAIMALYKGDKQLGVMEPERRVYKASRQPTTEVAIRPRLSEDVYVVFEGMSDDQRHVVISAHVNPLVNWIWVGGAILVFGTLVCLVPSRSGGGTKPRPVESRETPAPDVKVKDEVLVRSVT